MQADFRLCVRRGKTLGGNGTCPVFSREIVGWKIGKKSNTQPIFATDEASWAHHLKIWSGGCVNFKAGDLRVRAPIDLSNQELLF